MDERWRGGAEKEVARLRAEATAAREARDEADRARAGARDLFRPMPAALTSLDVGLADPGPARGAWTAWATYPDGDGPEQLQMLAAHIEQAWPTLSDTVTALEAAAEEELRTREDRWAPAGCRRGSSMV